MRFVLVIGTEKSKDSRRKGRSWGISAVWVEGRVARMEDGRWEGALREAAAEREKEREVFIASQKASLPMLGSLTVTWIETFQWVNSFAKSSQPRN